MEEVIEIDYRPREAFLAYHDSQKRYSLTIAHRRAGKTVARINKLIRKAVECQLVNPRFAYLAPYYVQAKDIAWVYLKHYSAPITALGGRINESELSVVLPHNNATIKLYGAENAERMRGLYFDGIVIDEAQGIASSVLTQVIMPALADRLGWLDVSGTPRGWQNLLGDIYKMAQQDDAWFTQVLPASQTGILPADELDKQRRMMSDNEYAQEFECDFEAALVGAIYGRWMADALKDGRITDRVAHDPAYPVFTAWDLGYDDATAIWFYQRGPQEVICLDYYEYSGEGIGHYCEILKGKGYNYHTHFVPQDAGQKLMAAGGRSLVEQAYKEHGIKLSIVPETTHANRHEAARRTLPLTWFHATKCHNGLEALRNYHYEYDEDLKMFRSRPRHDWSSHAATAFELLARMWADKAVTQAAIDKARFEADFWGKRRVHGLTAADPYRVKKVMGKPRR